jgi:hypothetical protein
VYEISTLTTVVFALPKNIFTSVVNKLSYCTANGFIRQQALQRGFPANVFKISEPKVLLLIVSGGQKSQLTESVRVNDYSRGGKQVVTNIIMGVSEDEDLGPLR